MSSRRAKQFVPVHHKNRRTAIIAVVVAIAILFILPATRRLIREGAGYAGAFILHGTHVAGTETVAAGGLVRSKSSILAENADLKNQIATLNAKLSEDAVLTAENTQLQNDMNRFDTGAHYTLASVLAKPPHSVYDTLVIDGGASASLKAGQVVYANGDTPIGTIATVLAESATVTLYTTPGQSTVATLQSAGIDVTLSGAGGGNFTATIPHDQTVAVGDTVVTKELTPHIIAELKKVTSDPRDPFQTLVLVSPVNMNTLSFVEVRQ